MSELARRIGGVAACAGGAVVFLAWEVGHRGTYQYTTSIYPIDPADEWRYTACSRLVEHGYALFSEVFSAQPPLLFLSLSWGMRLFGDSIAGARWVEIGFGVLGLGSAAWIAWLLAGPMAAAVTALLLAVSPSYLVYSHTVEAEGPMMALSTLSLALVLVFVGTVDAGRTRSNRPTSGGRRSNNRPTSGMTALGVAIMLVAGLALAAGILMKLFAVVALLPVLWIFFAEVQNRRQRVFGGVVYVSGAAIPVALDFALLDPGRQWDQVVTLHQRAADLQLPGMTPPLKLLGQFLAVDLGLSVLAAGGFVLLLLGGRWRETGFFGCWIGGSLAMLLLFRPLFAHHPAIVLTGLAACAGVGLGAAIDQWMMNASVWLRRREGGRGGPPQGGSAAAATPLPPTASGRSGSRKWERPYRMDMSRGGKRRVAEGAAILALVAYVGLVPRLAHADRHLLTAETRSVAGDLATYVRRHSSVRELVAADDLEVADRANRLVPPPLCDPSTVRLRAGYLTASDLVDATVRYRPRLVVPSFGIYEQVGGYKTWLWGHYSAIAGPDGQTVFVRR